MSGLPLRLLAIPLLALVTAACGGGAPGYGGSSTTTGPSGPPPPGSFSLTLTAGAFGSVSASPPGSGGIYASGTVVTLTATPVSGYAVGSWSGTDDDAATTATNQVTMNANRSVRVTFVLAMAMPANG